MLDPMELLRGIGKTCRRFSGLAQDSNIWKLHFCSTQAVNHLSISDGEWNWKNMYIKYYKKLNDPFSKLAVSVNDEIQAVRLSYTNGVETIHCKNIELARSRFNLLYTKRIRWEIFIEVYVMPIPPRSPFPLGGNVVIYPANKFKNLLQRLYRLQKYPSSTEYQQLRKYGWTVCDSASPRMSNITFPRNSEFLFCAKVCRLDSKASKYTHYNIPQFEGDLEMLISMAPYKPGYQ